MGCGNSKATITSDIDNSQMEVVQQKTKLEVTLIHKLYRNFSSYSKDRSMTRVDFVNMYFYVHEIKEGSPLANFLPRMYNAFDLDGNDSMDFEEFAMMIDMVLNGNADTKITAIYRLCDEDRSGTIDQQELVDTMKSLVFLLKKENHGEDGEAQMEALANEVFGEMDKDGDGRLTLSEFVDGFLRTARGKEICGLIYSGIVDVLTGGRLRQS